MAESTASRIIICPEGIFSDILFFSKAKPRRNLRQLQLTLRERISKAMCKPATVRLSAELSISLTSSWR
ncbi:hypothetical protein HFP57_10620 [Parasphingopyxis algicola]|uniref:hypothetical protein n=1 Tax=Parasphingopyxis algicola TaxID=2026624 RepID=UPI0015A0A7F1|nr:hypothetical protein [Parasphingopyxis algicola]QLC25432.1 hypothetical protein HFP57_10620 [Parasphingopyxis algicola]